MDLVDPPPAGQCVWSEPKGSGCCAAQTCSPWVEPRVTTPGAGQLFLAEERSLGSQELVLGCGLLRGFGSLNAPGNQSAKPAQRWSDVHSG